MKKSIVVIALALSIISCNKTTEVKEAAKTASIDTGKLMEQYTEAKDLNAKFKAKSEEIGRRFEVEEANFNADVAYFKKNANANGQAWAQQKGAELQKRQEELQYAAQQLDGKLRQEQGAETDSLVKTVKKFIADYGKKNGYSLIYTAGDGGALLYADKKYDITEEVVKQLNAKYASEGKKEEKKEEKK